MPRPRRQALAPDGGEGQTPIWQRPPRGWSGSVPEWAAYWALGRLGYEDGVTFFFQTPFLGGRLFSGGAVIDFWLPDFRIGIRIQGLYWHYGDPDKTASDEMQRVSLEGDGIRIVDVDEDDVLRAPIPIMRDAVAGIDHSRRANG